jgi:hypothetical protein
MRAFEDVSGTKADRVGVVVAPAALRSRDRCAHLGFDHGAHQRLLLGLTPTHVIHAWFGTKADALGLLQQQLADDKRAIRESGFSAILRLKAIARLPCGLGHQGAHVMFAVSLSRREGVFWAVRLMRIKGCQTICALTWPRHGSIG